MKKRDKRVQAYRKRLEERAAEIARQTEARKQQQRQERIKSVTCDVTSTAASGLVPQRFRHTLCFCR